MRVWFGHFIIHDSASLSSGPAGQPCFFEVILQNLFNSVIVTWPVHLFFHGALFCKLVCMFISSNIRMARNPLHYDLDFIGGEEVVGCFSQIVDFNISVQFQIF